MGGVLQLGDLGGGLAVTSFQAAADDVMQLAGDLQGIAVVSMSGGRALLAILYTSVVNAS